MRHIDRRHAGSRGNGKPHTPRLLGSTLWFRLGQVKIYVEDDVCSVLSEPSGI